MEKTYSIHFTGYGFQNKQFKSYDEAVEQAKRQIGQQKGYDGATIFEAVAAIKTPVPEYEVTKIT